MEEVCAVFCYCLLWLEAMDICIWCVFVFMSVVVIVWGSVGMCVTVTGLSKLTPPCNLTNCVLPVKR